ncbi:MAG: GC-type dockerin domain-anchored protein [Phycisphaerales bacterium JB039]
MPALRLAVPSLLLAAGLVPGARADFTDFDSFPEMSHGLKEATFDGIRFFEFNTIEEGVTPGPAGGPVGGEPFDGNQLLDEVMIEDARALVPDYPGFITPPNVLNLGFLGGYIPGPNFSFGRIISISMSTGEVETSAQLDVVYLDELVWAGIEVTLEATLAGQVVHEQTFIVETHAPGSRTDIVAKKTLSVDGVEFDTLRLYAHFGDIYTTLRGVLDNVRIGDGACRVDLDGDGELTFFDFLAFQNLFGAGDLAADFDGDGALTLFDFLAFQNEFAAGCP